MKRLPITQPPPDDVRSCGECQACCVVLQVIPSNDLDNGAVLTKRWEPCQWKGGGICLIYKHRPTPCAAYHCMWRLGWGDEDARPDRLGILAEGAPNGWLFVIETRPGGAEEPLAKAYMEAAAQATDSPAQAIHVTPWGAEPMNGGYWITDEPELVQRELESLINQVGMDRPQPTEKR